jgi:hypothetical protein
MTNDDIEQLDANWANALMANDVALLDQILAPHLIYGHASGVLDSKTLFLDKLRSGKQRYQKLERRHIKVQILTDHTAVTHSWMRAAGVNAKGSFDDNLMMMHVWTKSAGTWQLVAHQTAKVDKFPD